MAKTLLKLEWMADLKAEQDLQQLHIRYDVVPIPVSQIDFVDSQHNGARLGDPIVKSLVEDYKSAMLNGDVFPRIVAHKTPSGYVVLGGNQRCQAVRELQADGFVSAKATVEAYVLDTQDKFLLEQVARSGNVGHGGRSEKEERLAHAVYCVQSLGMRVSDAAKLFNVSCASINLHIRADKERRDLGGEGVDATRLTMTQLDALARLEDFGLKKKVAVLAGQHGVTAERLKQCVNSVKQGRSAAGRIKPIKDLEKELVESAHRANANGRSPRTRQPLERSKVPARPRRDTIIRKLTQLANFLDCEMDGAGFSSLADLQVSGESDEATIREQWGRIKFRMTMILENK